MFVSKLLLEFLPNVHLIGVFIVAFTVVYRYKALYPIYIFVFLVGLYNGFSIWWIPYLYLWAILWGAVMLLPKRMSVKTSVIVYALVCGLHGLCYGTLYAPAQALLFGYDLNMTLAWIAAGFPWDLIHGASNLVGGLLIVPLITLIRKLERTNAKNASLNEPR